MYEPDSIIVSMLERAFAHPWLSATIISLIIGGFLYLCACEMWAHENQRTDDYLDMMDGDDNHER